MHDAAPPTAGRPGGAPTGAVAFGINVTQDGSDALEGTVGPWCRLVVSDPHAADIVRAYQLGGYRVIAVAAKQVLLDLGYSTAASPRLFFNLFGHADAVQVWNEPDGQGSESDVAGRDEFQIWLWAFRDEAARRGWSKPLVAAGLVSGDPAWLDGLDMSGGYRLALHPYDQKPYAGYPGWGHDALPGLLDAYRPYLPAGTKFWLTECAATTEDEAVQAAYATALVESLAGRDDVDVALWYCWRDWWLGSTPRPFGLVRTDGHPKQTHGAWTAAVAATQTPSGGGGMASVKDIHEAQATVYQLANPDVAYNPGAAIAKAWLKLKSQGKLVGVPIGAEMSFPKGEPQGRLVAQGFTGGALLVWYGGEDVRVE